MTYTNPETHKSFPVFLHKTFVQYGEEWALVNKGTVKTQMVFKVRAANLVRA